jgi:CheY-like chemotaxis protein
MKIFVVDDDIVARMIVIDQLSDPRYTLREFADGASLLAAMADAPDLILLDIEMPGMNGIEACRAIRQAGNTQVNVIFVSARDDLDARLAAYDAGGSDFIIKPYPAEELAQKVRVADSSLEQRSDRSRQARFAEATAFTAMSSMGEMGALLQFLRRSYACSDPDQLAGEVLDAARQYDLPCLLQLRFGGERRCYSSKGACSPLEASILDHTSEMDRVFQFRDRLAINYPAITLLVQSLPLEDEERVGRLRDHLATLAEGADARLLAMGGERLRVEQASGIGQAVTDLTQALDDLGRNQARLRALAMEIDQRYVVDMVQTCIQLGLSEDQEATLLDLAQRTQAQKDSLLDDQYSLGDTLSAITVKLKKLAVHET